MNISLCDGCILEIFSSLSEKSGIILDIVSENDGITRAEIQEEYQNITGQELKYSDFRKNVIELEHKFLIQYKDVSQIRFYKISPVGEKLLKLI